MIRLILVLLLLLPVAYDYRTAAAKHVRQMIMPQDTIFYPHLTYLEPPLAGPGDSVTVFGEGGYIITDDGGLIEGWPFNLYFDDQSMGQMWCIIMECARTFAVPSTASPGMHRISVAGGSSLELLVVERSFRAYFSVIKVSRPTVPPPPPDSVPVNGLTLW